MKKTIFAACGTLFAASLCAGVLDHAWIRGVTDRNPLEYRVGDKMTFTLDLQRLDGTIPAGEYFLDWLRRGDDGKVEKGRVPLTADPFVYSTSISRPGFVRIYAEVVNKNGKPFRKRFTGNPNTPEGKKAMNAFERENKAVFFDGGAGADVEKLHGGAPEPADFDEFWAKQRARLAKVPIKAERIQLTCTNPNASIYAVEIACAGIRPVTGYLSIPKKPGKFPAQLSTHGYSYRPPHGAPSWAPDDKILLNINAHGMKLPAFGADEAYYRALGWEIKSHDQDYAFDPKQNADPEVAYFNGMALRVMRGLEYLRSLPEWNGVDLWAEGGSQGGLQTVWAASLDPKVTKAFPCIPWCCDMAGKDLDGRHADNWRIHNAKGTPYYDPVNLCKRIPRTCTVFITRAGLGDYCCPPSGVMALYNNMTCPKKALWVQGSQHGYVPPEQYKGRDFVQEAK